MNFLDTIYNWISKITYFLLGSSDELPSGSGERAIIDWPEPPPPQPQEVVTTNGEWTLLGVGASLSKVFKISSCTPGEKVKESCTSKYKGIEESKPTDKCDYRWDYLIRARKQSWETMFPGVKTCQSSRVKFCAFVGNGSHRETIPNHASHR